MGLVKSVWGRNKVKMMNMLLSKTRLSGGGLMMRWMSGSGGSGGGSLVIGESAKDQLSAATLSAVKAATALTPDQVTLLVLNEGGSSSYAQRVEGVTRVMVNNECEKLLAEKVTGLLADLQQKQQFSHILAVSNNSSKNYLPRLAAKCDVAPLTDVLEIVSPDTFKRPTYAGNAIATVQSKDPVKIMTIRPTGFEKAAVADQPNDSIPVEQVSCSTPDAALTQFVSEEVSTSDRPELTAARVVISGGRGLKNGENFALLDTLADKLKGAVGASRAAVDAGFVPNEYQVGQTGKVVAPDLYVAVGISGAIQHIAGMKDSKTIVCINKDEEAPIFQVSDYGLVADLFKAVPELTEKI